MKKFVNLLEKIQTFWGVLLFVVLGIVVFIQILSRFIFHNPVIWSEEVARFLLFWMVMMGASISVKKETHFTVEFIMPEKIKNQALRKIFRLIPNLCILLCGVVITIFGYEYFKMGRLRIGPGSNINMQYVFVAIPIAGVSMFIYSFYHIYHILNIKSLKEQRTGNPTKK